MYVNFGVREFVTTFCALVERLLSNTVTAVSFVPSLVRHVTLADTSSWSSGSTFACCRVVEAGPPMSVEEKGGGWSRVYRVGNGSMEKKFLAPVRERGEERVDARKDGTTSSLLPLFHFFVSPGRGKGGAQE